VLRAAVDLGVNHIDTAQYYGPGTVNDLIGEALYPYPNDLAIVSNVAVRRVTDEAVSPFDEQHELRQGIEDNLATLGTSRLATVNLPMMDQSAPPRSSSRTTAATRSASTGRSPGRAGGGAAAGWRADRIPVLAVDPVCEPDLRRDRVYRRGCAAEAAAVPGQAPAGHPGAPLVSGAVFCLVYGSPTGHAQLGHAVHRGLDSQEWSRYIPNVIYQETCPRRLAKPPPPATRHP